MHVHYLKHTRQQIETLQGICETSQQINELEMEEQVVAVPLHRRCRCVLQLQTAQAHVLAVVEKTDSSAVVTRFVNVALVLRTQPEQVQGSTCL